MLHDSPLVAHKSRNSLLDDAYVLSPVEEKNPLDFTVIWLHGMAETRQTVRRTVDMTMTGRGKMYKMIVPFAQIMDLPFNQYEVPAWYGQENPGWNTLDETETMQAEIDYDELEQSKNEVQKIMDMERKAGTKKIVLIGHDQGATLALYAGLSDVKKVTGIVVMNGIAVAAHRMQNKHTQLISEQNKNTPVLIMHGMDNRVLPWEKAKTGFEWLQKQLDGSVEIRLKQKQGHFLYPENIAEAHMWFMDVASSNK